MGILSWFQYQRQRGALVREGKGHWRRGEQDQAITCFEKSLEMDLAVKDADSLEVADDYDNLAVSYKALGDFGRALELLKKATAILESISVQHFMLPRCYNHLGIVYSKLDEYARAVECHEKALAIQKKQLGPFGGSIIKTTQTLLDAARFYDAKAQKERPPEPVLGPPEQPALSLEPVARRRDEITPEGQHSPENEAALRRRASRASAREMDRAFYYRTVGTAAQGAGCLGTACGAIIGLVIGWKCGNPPNSQVVFGAGGMVAGGVIGRHIAAFLAQMVTRRLFIRYRESFRRDYGEDL